jgi:ankyrin repeat protein
VKVLLAAGVDPARCRAEEGVTPLMVAAEGGHVDVVDALLGELACPACAANAALSAPP